MATKPATWVRPAHICVEACHYKGGGQAGCVYPMIMNIVAVVSLRGLPAEAEYGMSSAFYYLFAALVFLIPVSLVAAELASMFPYQQGGICSDG